jgi:hypothetical protein
MKINVAVVGKIVGKTRITPMAIAEQNEFISIGKRDAFGLVVGAR